MASRRQLEDELVHYSRLVHERGWVANHDGNLSVRLGDDRFLCTPTAESKGVVEREWLVVVNAEGKVVSGSRKVFSEIDLHLAIYRHRPDATAVLHAHPPTASGFAVAGVEVDPQMLAEPVVSLGRAIPLVPYARPKSPAALANLTAHLDDADVLCLERHGVIALGPNLETAYLRTELVEHLAKIQLVAMQLGGARRIPEGDVAALLEARTKAGLGKAARAGQQGADDRVSAVVRDEVTRALRDN